MVGIFTNKASVFPVNHLSGKRIRQTERKTQKKSK